MIGFGSAGWYSIYLSTSHVKIAYVELCCTFRVLLVERPALSAWPNIELYGTWTVVRTFAWNHLRAKVSLTGLFCLK